MGRAERELMAFETLAPATSHPAGRKRPATWQKSHLDVANDTKPAARRAKGGTAPSLTTGPNTGGTLAHGVLIVDDDAQRLARIESAIAEHFYVATSTSPAAALRMLECDHFDVVVADLCLSGMDSIEFLALARDFAPECATIMLAGSCVDAETMGALAGASVSALLTKPYAVEALMATLLDAVPRPRARE